MREVVRAAEREAGGGGGGQKGVVRVLISSVRYYVVAPWHDCDASTCTSRSFSDSSMRPSVLLPVSTAITRTPTSPPLRPASDPRRGHEK